MNFKIVKLQQYSGPECSVYTVLLDNGSSAFGNFVAQHKSNFPTELKEIATRIRSMATATGAREIFFRMNEGIPGDGVCAIRYADDAVENLRLYCVRYGKNLIIIGGGGEKKVRAWQDDPVLAKEVKAMIHISKEITNRISEKEIYFENDGHELAGDLDFNENEQ